MYRLPYPDTWEGDCRPDKAWAFPTKDGRVLTPNGELRVPNGESLRFVRLPASGPFKIAGKSQDVPGAGRTWEWVGGEWTDKGPNHGNNPVIYLPDGTLRVMQNAGPGTPATGWSYIGPDGLPVLSGDTFFDPATRLFLYTRVGPFIVGQHERGGIGIVYNSKRYHVEEDFDTEAVRATWNGAVLAIATAEYEQRRGVALFLTLEDVLANPERPVVVEPGGGGTGGGTKPGDGTQPGGGQGGGQTGGGKPTDGGGGSGGGKPTPVEQELTQMRVIDDEIFKSEWIPAATALAKDQYVDDEGRQTVTDVEIEQSIREESDRIRGRAGRNATLWELLNSPTRRETVRVLPKRLSAVDQDRLIERVTEIERRLRR